MSALVGCDYGVEWSEGEYEVHWIDTAENRTLARIIEPGSSIGRVEAEVIALGSDDNYIVAKQFEPETKLVHFFVIDKSKDGKYQRLDEVRLGPFSEEQFLQLKEDLDLPDFTIEFK